MGIYLLTAELMLTEHVIVIVLTILTSDFKLHADARVLLHVPVHQVIHAQFSAFATFTMGQAQ